jgi:hypothetical protein
VCYLVDRAAGTAQSAAELPSRHFWASADFTLVCNLPGGDIKAIPDSSRLHRHPEFMCLLFLAPVIDGNFHR